MHSQLWFLTNGVSVLSVFSDHKSAEQEMKKYTDDPDYSYYDYYSVDIDELEDYPDEYDMALGEGYLR